MSGTNNFDKKYFLAQIGIKQIFTIFVRSAPVNIPSKIQFLHNFRQLLENLIFEGISTGADLTKMVKICIISILAKLFVPLIKGSVSPQF